MRYHLGSKSFIAREPFGSVTPVHVWTGPADAGRCVHSMFSKGPSNLILAPAIGTPDPSSLTVIRMPPNFGFGAVSTDFSILESPSRVYQFLRLSGPFSLPSVAPEPLSSHAPTEADAKRKPLQNPT